MVPKMRGLMNTTLKNVTQFVIKAIFSAYFSVSLETHGMGA